MSKEDDFDSKYRPATLDEIIGHEQAVTRLKGVIKSGKIPGAMMFCGPSGVGKTTLGRAVATAINGKLNADYSETNAADARSIDDVREMIRLSKLRPMYGKKRIFLIDEFQGILTNKAAAQAFLKPLEEPSKDTLFILCSMEPGKLASNETGRAISNRCAKATFSLNPHTKDDLLAFAKRIAKGEGMKYMYAKSDDPKEKFKLLAEIAENCNGEMRTLAGLMQSAQQYYDGMDDAPKRLKMSDISSIIQSSSSSDDAMATQYVLGLFTRQFKKCHVATLNVEDGFAFVRKVLAITRYYLSISALEGQRHNKVWPSQSAKQFLEGLKQAGVTPGLGVIAAVNTEMVRIMGQAGTFSMEPTDLLSAAAYNLITQVISPAYESAAKKAKG